MLSLLFTPAAGKRLIGRAVARHPAVQAALPSGTVVVVAGTTNGCVAEELLGRLGQAGGFARRRFFRGVTLPPARPASAAGRLPDESEFPGDVVIAGGAWQRGQTLFDALDALKEGDVIVKGANAVNPARRQAGVLIGHPKGGTIAAALQAVIGRRVRLLLPVGLEKRVWADLPDLAARLNAPGAQGPRLCAVSGEIVTEIEALRLLTGVEAELAAAGGVAGAEGAVWLAVHGTPEQEQAARALAAAVAHEPPFAL